MAEVHTELPDLLQTESPTLSGAAPGDALLAWGSLPLTTRRSASADALDAAARVAVLSLSATTLGGGAQRNKAGEPSATSPGSADAATRDQVLGASDTATPQVAETHVAPGSAGQGFGIVKSSSERSPAPRHSPGHARHHSTAASFRDSPQQEQQQSGVSLMTAEQLHLRLMEECEARAQAEDEARMLQAQLLTWQQAASTAQSRLQSAQWCRDSLVRENLALQQSVFDAEEERRAVEAQLHQALAKLDEVKPGSKDEVMDSMRAQAHADPDNASACLQRYLALQQSTGEKMAALTEENNDLATRLVDVTLQLAQLKEEQARQQHHCRTVEEVNMSLIKRVEHLSELVAELKGASGGGGASSRATSSFVFSGRPA